MKITINGSPKELAELLNLLGGTENEAEKAEFPPLLTELAEDEKINELAEAIRNADKENAPQAETAEQDIPFIHFKPRFEEWIRIVRETNEGKENAPQAETAERQENQVLSREEAKEIVKGMDTAAKEAIKFLYHTP